MKKVFITIVLCLSLCLTLSNCDYWVGRSFILLSFANNSNQDVCFTVSGKEYPDTLFPQIPDWEIAEAQKEVDVYSNSLEQWSSREQYFKDFPVIQIFVVNREIAASKRPATIRAHKLVLRRYELTREWLEQHNWKVVYP